MASENEQVVIALSLNMLEKSLTSLGLPVIDRRVAGIQ